MTASITDLKHRAGKRLIDFAVGHLLRKDVAAVFREQLRLGQVALIERQQVTVQLREDLRDPAKEPEGEPKESGASEHVYVDYWTDVHTRPYYPAPNELPEGV